MLSKINIGKRIVGEGEPVFIIAEAGVNHNGDLTLAKKMIEVAKESGSDAVKFQSFKTEQLSTKDAPKSSYHIRTTGNKDSWFNLLKSQELDRKAHEVIVEYCKRLDIIFLSTPYDEESADLLEDIDVPAFKIASTDANNIPFLRYLARKNRPLILSTAMCFIEEVKESVDAILREGCRELILLHCTANYPSMIEDTNMRAMLTLKKEFNVPVGYSDHAPGYINSIAATAMGAVVYEKHFTLDKNLPGPDHSSSLNPKELRQLVRDIRNTETALGSFLKKPSDSEIENRQKLRKSIVAKIDIPVGTILTEKMVTMKRPGTGLAPRYFDEVLGKKTRISLKSDSLVKFEHLE